MSDNADSGEEVMIMYDIITSLIVAIITELVAELFRRWLDSDS